MRRVINPNTVVKPFARYSHGILTEAGVLYASGQLGILPDGSIPEAVIGQAEACFRNVEQILRGAGFQKRHVVRINAFVSARKHLSPYMTARDAWISDLELPPASTLVIAKGFARPEFKVEVEVTASLN